MDAIPLVERALSELRGVVHAKLLENKDGLTNAQLGRSLGLYMGHVGHQGCVSRTILEMLKENEMAWQDPATKRWFGRKKR